MNNLSLRNELNKLEEGRILNLAFDILYHSINLKVKVYQLEEKFETFNVIFSHVSSFYFVNDIGEERFNMWEPDPDDTKELTSIGYYKSGIGNIKVIAHKGIEGENWANYWYSSANFALDLLVGVLFIEARSITINDKTYEVGYPTGE